jgi:hypothetical protein
VLRDGYNHSKLIVASKRFIESRFTQGDWRELGHLTGTAEIIERHPRLLRSLEWGDDDYSGCVMEVLPQVLKRAEGGPNAVVEAVNLRPWLEENEPALYAELFSGEAVPLDDVAEAASVLAVGELEAHVQRIRSTIHDDPAQAIGSAKELLETVLRTILGEFGEQPAGDIQELLKRVQKKLRLDPASADGRPGAETIRRTLNSLGQVVVGVAEVRNLFGSGHGRSRAQEIERAQAKLVVNAAVTLATFLTDVFRASTWSLENPKRKRIPLR